MIFKMKNFIKYLAVIAVLGTACQKESEIKPEVKETSINCDCRIDGIDYGDMLVICPDSTLTQ